MMIFTLGLDCHLPPKPQLAAGSPAAGYTKSHGAHRVGVYSMRAVATELHHPTPPGLGRPISCASTAGCCRRCRSTARARVPFAVPAPVASRHRPDWAPVIVPSALSVHFWLAPPLQVQMSTLVPGAGALAVGVQAVAAVDPQLACGGGVHCWLAAAVAVPQLHLRAVRLRRARHVDAPARADPDERAGAAAGAAAARGDGQVVELRGLALAGGVADLARCPGVVVHRTDRSCRRWPR